MHNAHSSLKLQADYLFDWKRDVLDEANSGFIRERLKADDLQPNGAPSLGATLHLRRESTSTIAVSESAMEKWELLASSQDEPAVEEDLRFCCRASSTFAGSISSSDISFEEIGEDFPEEIWLDVSSPGRSGNGRNANRGPNSPRCQPCRDRTIDIPARPLAVPASFLEQRSGSASISPIDFEVVSVWSATDDGWMTPRSDRSFELDAEDVGMRDLMLSNIDNVDSNAARALDSPPVHLDGSTSNFVESWSRQSLLQVHESNDEEPASADPPLILTDAASAVSVGVETRLFCPYDAAGAAGRLTEIAAKDVFDNPEPKSSSDNSSSSVSLSAKDASSSGPPGTAGPLENCILEPSSDAGCITASSHTVSKATTSFMRPSPDAAAVQRFQTFVSYFRERRASDGTTRICTSEFAQELLKRDPSVYKKAGVSKLKRFLEEAEKSFVVVCCKWKAGNAWVEINPCLYPVRSPQAAQSTVTLAIVNPEVSLKPDSAMSVDAVYRPLVDCLNTRETHCLTYTAAGVTLLKTHPNLYKEAGASNLSTYLEKAEKQGIVRLGSIRGPGTEWVELMPAFHRSRALTT